MAYRRVRETGLSKKKIYKKILSYKTNSRSVKTKLCSSNKKICTQILILTMTYIK